MNEKGVCAEPRSWGPEKEEVNALKGPDKIKEQAMDTEVIAITAQIPFTKNRLLYVGRENRGTKRNVQQTV